MTIDLDETNNAQIQPFKYAVFSGGGAKGAIYSGVHEKLVKSGVLNELEAIAGSSAGAITAAFIATGITVPNMKNTFLKTNLNNLQGKGLIQKDAIPLYDLLHNTINNNIVEYFEKNNNIDEKCQTRLDVINNELNLLNEGPTTTENIDKIKLLLEDKDKLEDFKNNPEKLFAIQNKAQNNGQITFGDLDIMRAMDPKTFKGLIVTATNKATGELTIFDVKKFPNVEIALACRASSSLPLRFAPVEIDGQKYVDGGVRDNIPQKHFNSKDNLAQDATETIQDITDSTEIINEAKQKRTLVLAFGSQEENSPAHIAVYSAQEKITNFGMVQKFLLNVILKFAAKMGGEFVLTEDKNKGFENLRENALNTIILDTKDVTTLDFKKAEKKAEYLHEKGKIQAARYFNNHFIGNNQDVNLERKEFILKLYEENSSENLKLILNFCKDETWKNNDKIDILTSLINESAQTKNYDKQSADTKMMKQIVELLNQPTTPSIIKKDFIELLEIKTQGANLDYNFQTKDFEKIVQSRGEPIKAAVKTKSFVHKLLGEKNQAQPKIKQR